MPVYSGSMAPRPASTYTTATPTISGISTFPTAASYTAAVPRSTMVAQPAPRPTYTSPAATRTVAAAPATTMMPATTYSSATPYVTQAAPVVSSPASFTSTIPSATSFGVSAARVVSSSPASFPTYTPAYTSSPTYTSMSPTYTSTVPTYSAANFTYATSSANLLQGGQIISERIVDPSEYIQGGLAATDVASYPVGQGFTEVEGAPADAPADGAAEQPRGPVVVIVSTSSTAINQEKPEGQPTGAWLEEICAPYYVFLEAGCEVHLASIQGGVVPIDEASTQGDFFTESCKRFLEEGGQDVLNNSLGMGDVAVDQVDAVFLAGGHGTYGDFELLAQWVTDFNALGKTIGAVCHGPIALLYCLAPNEQPLLAGRRCTGFTDAEETAVGLASTVPFLLESKMRECGGDFTNADMWNEYAVRDGNLITGQNPQSSTQAALLCCEALQEALQQAPQ